LIKIPFGLVLPVLLFDSPEPCPDSKKFRPLAGAAHPHADHCSKKKISYATSAGLATAKNGKSAVQGQESKGKNTMQCFQPHTVASGHHKIIAVSKMIQVKRPV
jgi:hypothetical protein